MWCYLSNIRLLGWFESEHKITQEVARKLHIGCQYRLQREKAMKSSSGSGEGNRCNLIKRLSYLHRFFPTEWLEKQRARRRKRSWSRLWIVSMFHIIKQDSRARPRWRIMSEKKTCLNTLVNRVITDLWCQMYQQIKYLVHPLYVFGNVSTTFNPWKYREEIKEAQLKYMFCWRSDGTETLINSPLGRKCWIKLAFLWTMNFLKYVHTC